MNGTVPAIVPPLHHEKGDASLSAAFAELPIQRAESDLLAFQLREALVMVEFCRHHGDHQRAWLHLRMAEKILTKIEPEKV